MPKYYIPFKRSAGWFFLIPAKDGPPGHHTHDNGDIMVGPFATETSAWNNIKKFRHKK